MTVSWSETGYADVAALVRERTGLIFPPGRVRDVETTIQRTMERRGIGNLGRLLALLRDDDQAREAFVADLTIGESYFQRDPAQVDVLRSRILPDLLAARPDGRPIRLWSAGCATGEEPYTLAMLFEEIGAADRADIVGTDIARARLEEAQRGLYSKWQLRATPESVRRRYFAERGKYFELSPRIRRHVDFRYLNLAEDAFPSLTTGIWGMDVILCRNVLIYFDAPTVARVASRLIASLSEDGWLLMGASDPTISDLTDCDAVLTDAGLAYRRKGAGGAADVRTGQADSGRPAVTNPAGPTFESASAPATPDPRPGQQAVRDPGALDFSEAAHPDSALSGGSAAADRESTAADPAVPFASADVPAGAPHDGRIIEAYARRDFRAVQQLAEAGSSAGSIGPAAWIAWVRALANEGRHDEAAAVLDRAMRQGPTAELLYLQAVLLLQSGRPVDAGAAARRALYLDRNLVVAHLTLSEAQRRTGSVEGARRALRNAEVLLEGMDEETIVQASDGEAAGRLAELVRVKLRLLGGAA